MTPVQNLLFKSVLSHRASIESLNLGSYFTPSLAAFIHYKVLLCLHASLSVLYFTPTAIAITAAQASITARLPPVLHWPSLSWPPFYSLNLSQCIVHTATGLAVLKHQEVAFCKWTEIQRQEGSVLLKIKVDNLGICEYNRYQWSWCLVTFIHVWSTYIYTYTNYYIYIYCFMYETWVAEEWQAGAG